MMPKYLVETISMYRMRYVVKTNNGPDAAKAYVDAEANGMRNLEEFSQFHISENISSTRRIGTSEYLRLFNEDNDYLSDWTDEQKLSFVNKMKPIQ